MRTFRRETALYLLALSLGLALRLLGLGTPPLTDAEAQWALQALGIVQRAHPVLGSQPAYVMLTSVLFFVYGGGTNFLARLIPSLAGSALILAPRLFRERLKPRPALLLSFCIALEPGLVALSRQAGSSILAITALLFAWGLWQRRHTAWAGICAGLAALSGAPVWEGLLVFGLTWAIRQAWERGPRPTPTAEGASPEPPLVPEAPAQKGDWLTALWFSLGTLVVVGSLFLLMPGGLSAWLSGMPEYLTGWIHPSGVSSGLMLFSLLAYQPLGLILALVAAIRGWIQGSLRVMRLSMWMVVALLAAVFYPAHQIGDLGWMLIPLWALAAMELARSLHVRSEERRDVLAVIGITLLILVFTWLNFLALLQVPTPSDQASLRTVLGFGSLFLLGVSLLLVAMGWSVRVARYGAIWGLVAALGIYSFSALMGATGLRALPDGVDLWHSGGNLPEADLLVASVNNLSDWSDTNIHSQPVTIAGLDSPGLVWLLHDRSVLIQDTLDVAAQPPMVITPNEDNPTLAAAYRGQSFVWRRIPSWDKTGFGDWLRWLPFHQVTQQSDSVILWVRSDLFIDSTAPKP
jgi:hypothetical protein